MDPLEEPLKINPRAEEALDWSRFDYELPEANIAQNPAHPRDHSKLMIVHTQTGEILWDRFKNLDQHLPSNSLLFLNETAVVPCRVQTQTPKGKPLELLVMVSEWDKHGQEVRATANHYLKPQELIHLDEKHTLTVIESHEKIFRFKPNFPIQELPKILNRHGEMPIPKYIANCPSTEEEKRKKYQSIFAQKKGSAAAPTASLHFTPRVLKKLATKNIAPHFLTLHIGLGTFAPVLPEHLESKRLYEEYYEVPKQTQEAIFEAKNAKETQRPCIAVGTTATRALESWARLKKDQGPTDLFITPPYSFQVLDGLLTNFHLPKSSLMMLVDAFLQHKKAPFRLKTLYETAIQNEARFYSFGDAMLIID